MTGPSRIVRRWVLGSTAAVAAAICAAAGGAADAAADGVRAGDARVVEAPGSVAPRNEGGSATTFSIDLPDGASCPGDSAEAGYRVQSFFVPVGTDMGAIEYRSERPDVDGGWAVYKFDTRAYIQEQTANADEPGDPGLILPLPAMTFAVFTGGELAPGRYHMGIACSLGRRTERYWATSDVEIVADPQDTPAALRWRLVDPEAGGDEGRELAAVTGGLLAGGAVAAVAIRSRRRVRAHDGRPT